MAIRSKKARKDPKWRDQYRNPSPPPDHVKPESRIEQKKQLQKKNYFVCELLNLIIESGYFDEESIEEFPIPVSDEEEVVTLTVEPKVPEVIDLEDDPPLPLEVKSPTLKLLSPGKSLDKKVKSPSKHRKIRKENVECLSSDEDTRSPSHHHSKRKRKKHRKERRSSSRSPKKGKYSRSVSPKEVRRSRSPKVIRQRSRSPKVIRSRSKSPKVTRPRSRSPKVRGRRSRSRELRSRSRSPKRDRRSRSLSPTRSRYEDSDLEYKYNRSSPRSSAKYDVDYDEKYIKREFIKEECLQGEDESFNLFGSYYCKYCKSSMNSELTWEMHVNGKRHIKSLKLVNTAKTVADSIITSPAGSKYPPAPPNTYRARSDSPAEAQIAIEENVRTPCPGLEKVIEIRGIDGTHYFCEHCDAPCSMNSIMQHLMGYKHQLNLLKYFEPDTYESYRMRKKSDIEHRVIRILQSVQALKGFGKMTVENEFRVGSDPNIYNSWRDSRNSRREDGAGPSSRPDDFNETYVKTMAPDTSKSDYYCGTCDSHMNNMQMWESHIRGKRHIKNLKKAPGEAPSKTKSVRVDSSRARVMDELEHCDGPVIGLRFMRETQNPETGGVQYNCFLCGGCMTNLDVVDHIVSLKHRTKYLEKINDRDYMVLKEMTASERHLVSVIDEASYRVMEEEGLGEIEVHVTKNAATRWR